MKNEITLKIAEKLAVEIFSKMSNKKDGEFYLAHSRAVINTSLILAKGEKIDKNILEIAGWLHDIGYSISPNEHAKASLKILEKDYEINPILRDCILNHGNSGKPTTKEGKIIKIADKVSFLEEEIIKILMRYSKADGKFKEKDIEFLREMSSKACDLLREL